MAQRTLKPLPPTTDAPDVSLVLRTDFSNEAAWKSLCKAIDEPQTEDNFRAYVEFVSDPHYEGATVDELLILDHNPVDRSFFFIVDSVAISNPEHPILVLDVDKEYGKPGRHFRVIPSKMWSVQNNLSIANMDFREFSENVDPDGVFRGFN